MSSAFDDFNRADNTSLGASWNELAGDFQIVSNVAKCISASPQEAKAAHITAMGTNMSVQADIVASPNSLAAPGVIARCDTATGEHYRFGFRKGGTPRWWFVAVEGGSTSELASSPATAPSLPYRIRLEVEGLDLRGYHNDSLVLSYTNVSSVVPSGNHCGIMSSHPGDEINNWEAWTLDGVTGWYVGAVVFGAAGADGESQWLYPHAGLYPSAGLYPKG